LNKGKASNSRKMSLELFLLLLGKRKVPGTSIISTFFGLLKKYDRENRPHGLFFMYSRVEEFEGGGYI
jgi:hypothetical protein